MLRIKGEIPDMFKSFEYTGKTEDEAVALALSELNMTREEVTVEILERAKAGFFGIGSVPAKVRVSYEVPETQTEKLESFLKGLLEHMGVEANINIEENENGLYVNFDGEHIGSLIGHRGETLDAIQHLANYAVNKNRGEERTRISVDAENYRAKREDSLKRLAEKVAGKVKKYHRNITLEPMNAYERHVIHASLQDFDGVTTYSTGTEPNRRVVVALERQQRRSGGRRDAFSESDYPDYSTNTQTTSREWL
jgi:spoIIIJ-associated protein